jgi:hypothetical protein
MINPEALKENIKHEIEASKKSGDEAFRCTYQLANVIIEYIDQEIALRKSIEDKCNTMCEFGAADLKMLENHIADYSMYATYEMERARRLARLESVADFSISIDKLLNGEKE